MRTHTSPDDRAFERLVREALARLPAHAPEWTNHNASDPGVTLIELFAYFTEILLYRLARIPAASQLQFLRLLTGRPEWQPEHQGADTATAQDLARALDEAVRELSHIDCAVTARDVEQIAERAGRVHPDGDGLRALCIPGLDLTGACAVPQAARADVSVIVVPTRRLDDAALADLCATVRQALLPRSLIGTHLHVRGPVYVRVGMRAAMVARPGWDADAVLGNVRATLARRFGAASGPDHDGTETPEREGALRALYLSEIVAAIDEAEGVDHVLEVTVLQLGAGADPLVNTRNSVGIQIGARSTLARDSRLGGAYGAGGRLLRDAAGRLSGIRLQPWEQLELALIDPSVVASSMSSGRENGKEDG